VKRFSYPIPLSVLEDAATVCSVGEGDYCPTIVIPSRICEKRLWGLQTERNSRNAAKVLGVFSVSLFKTGVNHLCRGMDSVQRRRRVSKFLRPDRDKERGKSVTSADKYGRRLAGQTGNVVQAIAQSRLGVYGPLSQLRVFGFGSLEDGAIRISVLPPREGILIPNRSLYPKHCQNQSGK
jgi:hypothetical protein